VSFISFSFAWLYLAALALRWGLPLISGPNRDRESAMRVIALLTLSWVFYAWHVPGYILLILASTVVDYLAARVIDSTPGDMTGRRKTVLAVSLTANLGLLAYFKYAGFLVTTIDHATGGGWTVPDILLPIGISFYTFQSMSYTIDVYRGVIRAERSFLRVACYIAFFPQLVAGPIVRATEFLYQFDRRRRFHGKVFLEGAYLIVRGLFLKMVVANNLGTIVDAHWAQAAQEGQTTLALAMLVFFTCQLFCDFAAYVDIARGVAYQLGFRLPLNFNAPYIATTFSGFWRRWHITLSRWMRDYLYVSLGGNRKGRGRTYVNLLLVMLLSGLWHGANWTFVAWGGMLGVALAVERLLQFDQARPRWPVAIAWFLVVQLTWIFSLGLFRSAGIGEGTDIMLNGIRGLACLPFDGLVGPDPERLIVLGWWFTVPVWLIHIRTFLTERTRLGEPACYERSVYAGIMLAALSVLYSTDQQFIYFQF